MARTTEMRMAEPKNGAIVILVTRAISVSITVIFAIDIHILLVGLGAKLHHSKGSCCPRKSMAHVFCTDEGVNELGEVLI